VDVREQILDVAQDLIQREGIDAVSFRTLAEKVGIKSASVHYHFPKKDDLVLELTTRYTAAFGETLADIERTKHTARTRLRRLVEIFQETNSQEKICYCATLALVSNHLAAESRLAARDFFVQLRGWIEDVLRHGAEKDEFELAMSVPAVGRAIAAALEGALLIDHLEGTSGNLDATKKLITTLLAS